MTNVYGAADAFMNKFEFDISFGSSKIRLVAGMNSCVGNVRAVVSAQSSMHKKIMWQVYAFLCLWGCIQQKPKYLSV